MGEIVIYEFLTKVHQLLADNIKEYEKLSVKEQNIILATIGKVTHKK